MDLMGIIIEYGQDIMEDTNATDNPYNVKFL